VPGQQHPQGIAQHETEDRQGQAQHQRQVGLADGHRQARGIAAHERNEITQRQQADGVGHARQHRQPGHQPQADAAAQHLQPGAAGTVQGRGGGAA
jgi:hypothetical protein